MVTRRFWLYLSSAFLLILIGLSAIWLNFLYQPLVTDEQGFTYTVQEGSSINLVIDDLANKNIIKNPRLFRLLVRLKGVSHQLKAGKYLFPKNTSSSRLLQQIITGSGLAYQSFMIVPGWSFKEVMNALSNHPYLHHTIENLNNSEIMRKIGHPDLNPEGQFFPDTYFFTEGSDDIIVLKRAFKAMQDKLQSAWKHRASNLPFKTPYEALIAASIIEKEAYLKDELPKIAGVMVNRLRVNMLLQFDPTVIYGHSDRTIRRSDLLAKNPYNTYKNKGLPPTPISMPSLAAIKAILHPTKHNYYYFVAQGDGSSLFSKHLIEHHEAVEMAKKTRWFFNYTLTRSYLLKSFPQIIIRNEKI